MIGLALMLPALALTGHGFVQGPIGTLTITGEIVPSNDLSVEMHDLGSNVVAYVASYDEHNTHNARHETVETLAMRDDGIDVEVSETLAIRRWRRDGWPVSGEALAMLVRR